MNYDKNGTEISCTRIRWRFSIYYIIYTRVRLILLFSIWFIIYLIRIHDDIKKGERITRVSSLILGIILCSAAAYLFIPFVDIYDIHARYRIEYSVLCINGQRKTFSRLGFFSMECMIYNTYIDRDQNFNFSSL